MITCLQRASSTLSKRSKSRREVSEMLEQGMLWLPTSDSTVGNTLLFCNRNEIWYILIQNHEKHAISEVFFVFQINLLNKLVISQVFLVFYWKSLVFICFFSGFLGFSLIFCNRNEISKILIQKNMKNIWNHMFFNRILIKNKTKPMKSQVVQHISYEKQTKPMKSQVFHDFV